MTCRSASSAACDDEVDEDGDWHLEQQAEALADRYFCSLSAGATGVATLADDLATDVVRASQSHSNTCSSAV